MILPSLVTLALPALADIQPGFDRFSGCGLLEPNTSSLNLFDHCIPAEWEALLVDSPFTINNPDEALAVVALPDAGNEEGCNPHAAGQFDGKIALLQRGTCAFAQKGIYAEMAGALAFLIIESADAGNVQVWLMAISAGVSSPRLPGYLIGRTEGLALQARLQAGEVLQAYCSWKPVRVWYDLPETSTHENHSWRISNTGDETMPWSFFMNRWFANPPLYNADPVNAPGPFNGSLVAELYDGSVVEDDGTKSLAMPFPFYHFRAWFSSLKVSTNGLLSVDSAFTVGSGSGILGDPAAPNGLVAPFWDSLICDHCRITASDDEFQGVDVLAVRFEDLSFVKDSDGNLTFEAWLYADGRVLLQVLDYPASASMPNVKMGLESLSGAESVSVDTASLPWSSGEAIAVLLEPWYMPRGLYTQAVEPGSELVLSMGFRREEGTKAWGYVQTTGINVVRFSQIAFRLFWHLTAWDAGLHTGSCEFAPKQVRHRNKSCMASDGVVRPYSVCEALPGGGWADSQVAWTDLLGYTCEDYLVLALCTSAGGYGEGWRSGTFANWAAPGQEPAHVACCACGGGLQGVPAIESDCPSVSCPENSTGVNVVKGCNCLAGYYGTVFRSASDPYWSGGCIGAPCPGNSTGIDVPTNCTCDPGFEGEVIPSTLGPGYYTGGCTEITMTQTTSSQTATMTSTLSSTRSSATTTLTTRTASTSCTVSTTRSSSTASSSSTITSTTSSTTSRSTSATMTTTATASSSTSSQSTTFTASTFTVSTSTASTVTTTSTSSTSTELVPPPAPLVEGGSTKASAVIVSIVLLTLLCCVCICALLRRRKKRQNEEEGEQTSLEWKEDDGELRTATPTSVAPELMDSPTSAASELPLDTENSAEDANDEAPELIEQQTADEEQEWFGHVGPGNGNWEKAEQFRHVGPGSGAWQRIVAI
mmetsp:Transcript_35509/g.64404  ORF Transcript_35509/g.64404 Transcript_35509/m.64404 type:complete len:932 (-) Transcript_35509:105-2900(-)